MSGDHPTEQIDRATEAIRELIKDWPGVTHPRATAHVLARAALDAATTADEPDRLHALIQRGLAYGDAFRTPYAAGARAELRRIAGMHPRLDSVGERDQP